MLNRCCLIKHQTTVLRWNQNRLNGFYAIAVNISILRVNSAQVKMNRLKVFYRQYVLRFEFSGRKSFVVLRSHIYIWFWLSPSGILYRCVYLGKGAKIGFLMVSIHKTLHVLLDSLILFTKFVVRKISFDEVWRFDFVEEIECLYVIDCHNGGWACLVGVSTCDENEHVWCGWAFVV